MKFTPFAFALSVLCPAALAQEPPAPATQLKKLEPVIGDWQVSGTGKETADGEDIPWTARQSSRWVLGGHFVKDEIIADLGEAMPNMASTSFTGWDNETQRYMMYAFNNMGLVVAGKLFFTDDNTMVGAYAMVVEGQPVVERSVFRIGEGTYDLEVQMARGDGPFFTSGKGSARRTVAEGQAQAVETSMSFAPPVPEMAVLGKMSGEYRSQGWVPNPVAPEMGITGTHTVRLIFGGTVQEHHVRIEGGPDEPTYEAFRYTAWSAADNCYNVIQVDNHGVGSKTQLHQVDDRTFVEFRSVVRASQPTVSRSVQTCDAQGSIAQWVGDAFVIAGEAQRVFSARFRKIR